MKKNYIIPVAKTIHLDSEANMLVTVSGGGESTTPDGFNGMNGGDNSGYGGTDLSNRRNSIWGDE